MDWFSLDTEKVREVTASEYSHDLYIERLLPLKGERNQVKKGRREKSMAK